MAQIREMVAEDADAVCRLYSDSWRQSYSGILGPTQLKDEIRKRFTVELQSLEAADPHIITLVAVKDDEVIGASLSKMDARNQAWIDRIHVVPDAFGSGVAEDLLRATLAKHSGLQSIALKVLKGNDRAIAFYEKHGFAVTDEIAGDAEVGGVDSLIMSRTIPRS